MGTKYDPDLTLLARAILEAIRKDYQEEEERKQHEAYSD